MNFSSTSRRNGTTRPTRSRRTSRDLGLFTEFCDRYYGTDWEFAKVDRLGLRGFLGEFERRGLARRTAARALSAVRSFYRYLQVHHDLAKNPLRAVKSPKLEKRLPRYLRLDETDQVFAAAESAASEGEFESLRDLAMLELFYSSGIRLSELRGLNLASIDMLADQVKVLGKGRKERIVPVGSARGEGAPALFREPGRRGAQGARPAGGIREPPRQEALPGHHSAPDPSSVHGRRSQGLPCALTPAHLCDAHDGRRRRPEERAGDAGARFTEHDASLYPHFRGAAQAGVPAMRIQEASERRAIASCQSQPLV